MQKTEEIKVYGMMCEHCVKAVTKAVDSVEGVISSSVSLKNSSATISFDNSLTDTEHFKDIILKQGFFLEPQENSDKPEETEETTKEPEPSDSSISFNIEGMSCANCSATIEKALKRVSGITKATVNFSTEKGVVYYDNNQLKEDDIFNLVNKAGYRAFGNENTSGVSSLAKKEKFRFVFALVFTIPVVALMHTMPLGPSKTNYLIFAFATLVQFVSGRTFYEGAWNSLKNRSSNMDVLVSLGISSAYFYSVFSLFFIDSAAQTFFDSSAMLITFIMIGKMLEARAKGKTGQALQKLMSLQAENATMLKDGKEVSVKTSDIKKGDIVIVRPGEKIPVDGIIVSGSTTIDESMITGESIPSFRKEGDKTTGATINKTGVIKIETGSVGNDTVLSGIVRLVEEAQNDKAPVQRLADIVSNFFVPAVITIAIITFIFWYYFASASLAGAEGRFLFALRLMIAVLVVACPCALGLATPTAIMVGSGVGLNRGILFKKASVLENISKLDVILFDKTGTITQGKPELTGVYPLNGYSEEELIKTAAAVEKGSRHPLAEAIVQYASGLNYEMAENIVETSGKGTCANYLGGKIKVGNSEFVCSGNEASKEIKNIEQILSKQGESTVYISIDDKPAGIIGLADTIKSDSAKAIKRLHSLNIKTALVSGDNAVSANAIAAQVGIDDIEAEVRPKDKIRIVKKWQAKGYKVGMAGDGINDAPALAQADIGIAIGSGTDVAKETGDLILVNNSLLDVERAIKLGKKTLSVIKQNFFWAFFYNILMIPVAAGVFYSSLGISLKPEWAGVAMWFSSLTVVLNSLMLKNYKKKMVL